MPSSTQTCLIVNEFFENTFKEGNDACVRHLHRHLPVNDLSFRLETQTNAPPNLGIGLATPTASTVTQNRTQTSVEEVLFDDASKVEKDAYEPSSPALTLIESRTSTLFVPAMANCTRRI